jgi:glycosidase
MTEHSRRAWRHYSAVMLFCLMVALLGTVNVLFAAAHDNNIQWNDLLHHSRELTYRTPGGAVPVNTTVRIRIRAAKDDLTGAQMRIWNDRLNQQSFVNMTRVAADDTYEYWEYTLNTGAQPNAYYYRFILTDGTATAYYQDDDQLGGAGNPSNSGDDFKSWQLTVYDPTFTTPDWVKNAVIYQIFVDRFRDGNAANGTPPGTFFYNEAGGTIFRSVTTNWNQSVCDPRVSGGAAGCEGSYSRNFYGGDLKGVLDKLDYLQDLGVTAIYFNPIFESPSNHKYDTTDFLQIDDNFGDLALFQTLATEANQRGIRIILDGVFNHTSSDSHYFDRYDRYDAFLGACEDVASPFRDWYYFIDPPQGQTGVCAGNKNYESWFGYDSLPKLQANSPEVRELIWADGTNSVAPYWVQWADGWRLDVGGDVDPGTTNDPNNNYWEGFRNAVRTTNPEAYIVGEEWGNATPWLLGTEWDATMNYQYSSAMLSFWRDTPFNDNDHNSGSSAGVLSPISSTVVNERLLNWQERYPAESYYAQMNLLGSHDTSRALFMLEHSLPSNPANLTAYPTNPNHDWSDAITRLKGVVLMQMTLPGAPTIYYGDEVGLVGQQTWAGGKWEDDPYNRQPYPWLDESGTPFFTHLQSEAAGSTRAALLAYYKTLTAARNAHPALRTGSFDPLLMQDFPADPIYVYGRKMADHSDAAVVFINRSTNVKNITVNVLGYLPAGAAFDDALTPAVENYTVAANGDLTVNNVPARSGALLVLKAAAAQAPAAVSDLNATGGVSQVTLNWSAAAGTDEYDIYRSILTGGGYTKIGTTATLTYNDTAVVNGTMYYYVIVGKNTTTGLESGYSNEDSATPQWDMVAAVKILQFPFEIEHIISTTDHTDPVYGQIYIEDATDVQDTVVPGVRAQVGFGPDGSTPDDTWTWTEMIPNPGYDFGGNNDEYIGDMLPTAVGEYDYTVRFSGDNGITWHYATVRDGGGSPIGDLTVIPSSDANKPSAPSNLAVASTTNSSIKLTWQGSTDTRRSGRGNRAMDSYRIYRDESPADNFVLIASVDDTVFTYTDTDVVTGESYDYYVTALDDSFNESDPSNTVTAAAVDVPIDVTFRVTVPDFSTGTVYIVGNQPEWGPWNPGLAPMTEVSPGIWETTFTFLSGTALEYKYTRGSWETVEKQANGTDEVNNRPLTVTDQGGGNQLQEDTVINWRDILVKSTSPADGATGVPPNSTISIVLNKDIDFDAGTFSSKFVVTAPDSSIVEGTYTYDNTTDTVTFTPSASLAEGEYSVTVSGLTLGGDTQQAAMSFSFTVSIVPTETPTAEPLSNLLIDGDMEVDTNEDKVPDAWTGKNLNGDKQKCNKDTDGDGTIDKFVAYNGNCAFQFKSVAGESSKIYQDVDLTAYTFASGETLTFTGYASAKEPVQTKIKLEAKYSNGLEKTKQNVSLVASESYTLVTGSITLAAGSADLERIRVQINHKGLSGRVRIDALTLTKGTDAAFLPLP